MKDDIFNIEKRIFPESELHDNYSFLAKGLSPTERILKYSKDPKTCFQYICALNGQLSFDSNSAHVTLLPAERQDILDAGKEMYDHGTKTGRFNPEGQAVVEKRILADIVKGNTGEQAGINLLNDAFRCFGLETRLKINKLKYDGRGDGGKDAVIGLYGIDFKYRNDVNEYIDLVVSSFDPSPYLILVHTHSIRRKDDQNYNEDFYLNVNDSSHVVVVRGGTSGVRFAERAKLFQNGRKVLEKSRKELVPIWDLVLFLAIQAAKQEGYVE
jgi:hypothetical protein